MSVSQAQSFASANLYVRVIIEPHASNRTLEIIADPDEFYRSSEIQLDGDRALRTIFLQFRSLPGGHYVVRGTLIDGTGHERASVREQVTVIPSGGDR